MKIKQKKKNPLIKKNYLKNKKKFFEKNKNKKKKNL